MSTLPRQSIPYLFIISLLLSCRAFQPDLVDRPAAMAAAVSPSPASPATPTSTPSSLPTPLPTPTTRPTPLPDTGWHELRPGMERRLINLFDETGRLYESLYLLRLQPTAFRFEVAYQPGQPQSLAQWQQQTDALVIVNGGYFTPEFTATGLIVVDGHPSGRTFQDFGGMLAVGSDGPDLRSLRQEPYDPAEPLQFALQSFPVLIQPIESGYVDETGAKARRTVIAVDRAGRFIFLVAQWGGFSLGELSQYLLGSDLDLEIAVNLDGGASSGILLSSPEEGIPSFSPLPAVITVHPLP